MKKFYLRVTDRAVKKNKFNYNKMLSRIIFFNIKYTELRGKKWILIEYKGAEYGLRKMTDFTHDLVLIIPEDQFAHYKD